MKKILLSISLMAIAGAVTYGATGAFFSDTETSTGNTFTAGDIDLKIDNESYVTNSAGALVASPANSWEMADLTNQLFFSFGDVKPGDVGEDTISIHAGSNDAYACMAADITSTPDNGINDPESDAGDITDGALGGELQNYLNFAFWNDDGDNVYEVGEAQITALTGPASSIFNGAWSAVVATSTNVIPANSVEYVAKAWCFGALTGAPVEQDGLGKTQGSTNGPLVRGTGFTCDGSGSNNIAQTDGVVVDVSFQSVQARNNPNFTCASLPAFNGTTTITWVEEGIAAGGDATVIGTSTENGSNALQLTTIDDVDSRVRYTYDIADINASAFTGFSFDSKQVKAFDMVNGNASFRLVVDLDGNLGTLGDVKDVTFEPYYNILAHNGLNDAAITPNVWQNWAATLANGKFWAGGVTTVLGPSEGAGGAYATNFTIQQLVDSYPSAKIIGISIGMGTYNKDQIILVDNLIFNGTVLGFE